MSITISDIPKKYVRKFVTERETVLYAVTVSVCRSMSSNGFVTFVCDDAHIELDGYKYILDFNTDRERTFTITNNRGQYTTAQLLLSDVAKSHIESVEERRAEKEAEHLKELEKVLFDTKYFSLHINTEQGDKLYHSFKSIDEANKEIKSQVFKILDTDLNNDILHGEHGKYDLEILTDKGYLIVRRTIYKRNAFAASRNEAEYVVSTIKDIKYYVRNDKHQHIILWDWGDILNDIDVRCMRNDNILNEERTEEEWAKVKEIAAKNAKLGCHNVENLSKDWVEPTKQDEFDMFMNNPVDILKCQNFNGPLPSMPAVDQLPSPFKPISTTSS